MNCPLYWVSGQSWPLPSLEPTLVALVLHVRGISLYWVPEVLSGDTERPVPQREAHSARLLRGGHTGPRWAPGSARPARRQE